MNENIDLTKILKDCPKGFKLYTPLLGEVEFKGICSDEKYNILVSYSGGESQSEFTKQGFYYALKNAECLLFPSAEQRDWRKFKAPWYKKEMDINSMSNKDNERLRKTAIAFLKDFAEQGYENAVECIDWLEKQGEQASSQTNEELIREWTIQDAKDGDILACNEEILLFKSYSALQGRISLYCWYNGHTNNFHSKEVIDMLLTTRNKICPATKEQRDALMKAMNDAGYEWDAEKKELKKLVEPKFKVGDKIVYSLWRNMRTLRSQGIISEITDDKYIFTDGSYIQISNQDSWDLVSDKFDPKTLQVFDKVLVRDSDSANWMIQLFSHIIEGEAGYPYLCINSPYKYCIPCDGNTKHLLGTNEEAPKYYRYWED